MTNHRPTRTTARKIANVLLTKPSGEGVDEICKLKDIGSLDGPIFGEHQKAIKAVEQMYGSMWRLTVFVAPEHLPRYKEISETAGRVIFKTIDVHGQFADRDMPWENDPNLERELAAKLAPTRGFGAEDDSELSPLGELVGRLSDQLFESGRLKDVSSELFGSADELPADVRMRIQKGLLGLLGPDGVTAGAKPAEVDPAPRIDQ